VTALNSLQTNAKVLAEQRRTGARDLVRNFTEVTTYAKRIGVSKEALNALNAVHIAGSKGKGWVQHAAMLFQYHRPSNRRRSDSRGALALPLLPACCGR
jgi:hypothetical protein